MELHEDTKVFAEAISAASEYLNINPVYVEKDYWITRSLRLLARDAKAGMAIFKGGTSLSKAYKIGCRFSEDIDIAIANVESLSGNQVKMLIKRIAKGMTSGLEEISVPGVTSKGSRYCKAMYVYPQNVAPVIDGMVNVGRLLVEVNSFANPYPYEQKRVGCFLADFFSRSGHEDIIQRYGLKDFLLNVLDKRQTLTEKMVSLIRFSFSEDYLAGLVSKIRHFYDLYYLMQENDCIEYVSDGKFKNDFETLLNHDKELFENPFGWRDKPYRQSPLLMDFCLIWSRLRETYKREMSDISFAAIPDEKAVADNFMTIIEALNQ